MASSGDEPRLFDVAEPVAAPRSPAPVGRVVTVVVDVASIDREFDYVAPDRLLKTAGFPLTVGTMVRVPLHGRQVAGWIVAVDVDAPRGVEMRAISKISGVGPPADLVELCRWAAWRWAGRLPAFLGAASPATMVRSLPSSAAELWGNRADRSRDSPKVRLVRVPPAASPVEAIVSAAAGGNVLVVAPTFVAARSIADGMRRSGVKTAVHPDGWAKAAAGCSLVGARSAVFAPVGGLAAIVVVDEHDEALQNEGSPTWHARDVAIERGRRAGVPVVLLSPTPSLEALAAADEVSVPDRGVERAGWAPLRIIDRREEDIARSGLYSEELVGALRAGRRCVCVLNRIGRAQMLGCQRCGTLAACERCDAAVRHDDPAILTCPRCGTTRPVICANCASTAFRSIRIGITKAREQLEALLREPVDEIAGNVVVRSAPARVLVGTEAVLQRVSRADVVAFLEFDQELGAPRYRAAEQALTLLARASRLVGGRSGTVLVQTRQPEHPVLQAGLRADPAIVAEVESRQRALLELPPAVTLAVIGGEAAAPYIAALGPGLPANTVVDQIAETQWLVRCPDRDPLLDALAAVKRPSGRLRLQIDPARMPKS